MSENINTEQLRSLTQYPGLQGKDSHISKINYKKIIHRTHIREYSVVNYILLFFIFSFIAWVYEVGIHVVEDAVFVNRGTLLGPWLPIYGVGGVLGVLFLRKIENKAITFICLVIFSAIIEYSTSWFIEHFKHAKYWNYDGYFCNINGRICLEGVLVFGFIGCAAVYILAPFFDDLLKKVSLKIRIVASVVLILIFIADIVYSRVHPNAGEGITDYIYSPMSVVRMLSEM